MAKKVSAWLRMDSGYGKPMSDASYYAHTVFIDNVLPSHGGKLIADGSWSQENWKLTTDFALALPSLAAGSGQQYYPVICPATLGDLYTVLDSTPLRAAAVAGLVTLATTGRFDSPWDGVIYDIPWCDPAYVSKHEDFLAEMSLAVRAEGIVFGVAYRGVTQAEEGSAPSIASIQATSDLVLYYVFKTGGSASSIQPYGWIVECVENAINDGLQMSKAQLGIMVGNWYWPVSAVEENEERTYEQILQLVVDYGSYIEWIEGNGDLIRESYATLGDGHAWISDGDTMGARLTLLDAHGMAGTMLWVLGPEPEGIWQAIADWKRPIYVVPLNKKPSAGKLFCKLGNRVLADILTIEGFDCPAKIRAAIDEQLRAVGITQLELDLIRKVY